MMKKISIALTITLATLGSGYAPPANAQNEVQAVDQLQGEDVKNDEIVMIDNGAGTVTISGFLNTRYIRTPSTSLLVFREGFNAKRGLFISNASPSALYNGLVNIGAVPAVTTPPPENDSETPPEQPEPETGEPVEPAPDPDRGTHLRVFFKWEEAPQEYRLDEIVSQFPRQNYDIRFKGNMENSKSVGSGDLLCLDDTEIGITGNSAIPGFRKNTSPVSFTVNKRLLPPNGHHLKIVFQIVPGNGQDPEDNDQTSPAEYNE